MNKKQVWSLVTNVGVVIAIGGAVAFGLGYIDQTLFVTLLGLGGFSGLAGLRDAISSSGYKTLIIAAFGAATALGVAFDVVSSENATLLLSVLGIGAIPTLSHAIKKQNQ